MWGQKRRVRRFFTPTPIGYAGRCAPVLLAELHAAEERGGALGRHLEAGAAGWRGSPVGGAGGRGAREEEEGSGQTHLCCPADPVPDRRCNEVDVATLQTMWLPCSLSGAYTNYRGFGFPSFSQVLGLSQLRRRGPAASDHGVRATARAPSRTPLSQSASALLNVKVCNCGTEVHQNGASADTLLPSSILQQLVHLSFMLHACREWLYRQVSLLSGCLSRGSSTAARVLRQCRA